MIKEKLKNFIVKTALKLSSKTDAMVILDIVNEWLGASKEDSYFGAVYNATSTWGLFFAKAKFRVYKQNKDGLEEVLEDDALKLFKEPNYYETWWEMCYKIPALFGIFGRAFIIVLRKGGLEDTKGKIMAYELMPPRVINVRYENNQINYYFVGNGKERKIPNENIIDLRYPHPFKMLEGHPIIESVLNVQQIEKIQELYMKEYWTTGGFMGLTFSTEQDLTKQQYDSIYNRLNEKYTGTKRAFKLGLLTNGLKPVKTSYSMKEHDMTGQRKYIRDEIYQAFKVSNIMMGGGENYNRAVADAQIFQFTSNVIDPILNYIDAIFTKFIQKNYNKDYIVIHDTIAPKDVELKLRYYESGLKNGWLVLNEVREMEGFNKYNYESANKPYVNVGGALIDYSELIQIGKVLPLPSDEKKNLTKADDGMEGYWENINDRHFYWTRRFGKRIEGYYYDQQRRILDAVLQNFIVEQAFDLQNENLILSQLLEIDLWDIMKDGWTLGDYMYETNTTFNKERFEIYYEDMKKLFLEFNEYVYENIISSKSEEELKSKYESLVKNEAKSVVITSVTGSINAGLLNAMKDAGIKYKMWLTFRDERVRNRINGENHVIMDGVTIPVDEYFKIPSRSGFDYVMYPGDPNASPENLVNERCTIIGRKELNI